MHVLRGCERVLSAISIHRPHISVLCRPYFQGRHGARASCIGAFGASCRTNTNTSKSFIKKKTKKKHRPHIGRAFAKPVCECTIRATQESSQLTCIRFQWTLFSEQERHWLPLTSHGSRALAHLTLIARQTQTDQGAQRGTSYYERDEFIDYRMTMAVSSTFIRTNRSDLFHSGVSIQETGVQDGELKPSPEMKRTEAASQPPPVSGATRQGSVARGSVSRPGVMGRINCK